MNIHPENDPAETPEVRELFGVIASCYPSARNPRGKNLVMFPSNFMKSSVLEILGKEDLG